MRLSTVVVIALALPLVACGDEPEPEPPRLPAAPEQPAVPEAPPDALDVDTLDPATRPDPARPGEPDAGEAAPDVEAAEGERLFTVQVASFTNPESAELWRDRLSGQGLPAWTAVTEVGGRTFYRVRIGATPTVSEARRLGDSLSERYQWPVWVAPMTPADRPPRGAVERTRSLIGSS